MSKLERNTSKDRDDADYLFGTKKLDSQALRERYQQQLRPYLAKENWHDKRSNFGSRSLRPLSNSQTPATYVTDARGLNQVGGEMRTVEKSQSFASALLLIGGYLREGLPASFRYLDFGG